MRLGMIIKGRPGYLANSLRTWRQNADLAKKGLSLAFGLAIAQSLWFFPAQADQLKGGVEEENAGSIVPMEPIPVPVLKKPKPKLQGESAENGEGSPLNGGAKNDALSGNADSSDPDLKSQAGRINPDNGVLKGGARVEDLGASEDPDTQDQELQVEWDRWRNRFLRAVLAGAQDSINSPDEMSLHWDPQRRVMVSSFPMGVETWFSCKITRDRRILSLRLEHSSGYPNYDQAVLNSVRALAGTTILKFPERSRRDIVSQAAGVKTADHSEPQKFFKFGDVERVRQPAN
jgi:hypothetical protein